MIYDKYALLTSYIEANRDDHWHPDFAEDAKRFLNALEQAFSVRIHESTAADFDGRVLSMVFRSTLRTFLMLKGTRAGFLDDSLINTRLDLLGDVGQRIKDLEGEVNGTIQEGREQSMALLRQLFDLIWPIEHLPVTSEDLRRFDYDDSKRPRIEDYWDKI